MEGIWLGRFGGLWLLAGWLLVFGGCSGEVDKALGTLEWDRVNGRAPASEVIIDVLVMEGQRVAAGDALLVLDHAKIDQRYLEQQARLERAEWQLKELEQGPRAQVVAEARARLDSAKAALQNDYRIYQRQQDLYASKVTSRQNLDSSQNNYVRSREKVKEYGQQLDELLEGTRTEQIEQARAQVKTLEAVLEELRLQLEEYTIRARRDGLVDSLPYRLGDRPPAHAVVSTVLAGHSPWARVYVPSSHRAAMKPGEMFELKVDGVDGLFKVKVRTISSEASFTPYFALSERDRSRLSYVAELEFIEDRAGELTAGIPVELILENK